VSIKSFAQCGYQVEILKITNVSCNGLSDGEIEILVNGGSPPYFFNGEAGGNIFKLDSLSAGVTNLLISDSEPCDTLLSFVIDEPQPLSSKIEITSFCDTSLIKVIPIGGTYPYEFILNNSLPLLTDTAYYVVGAGDYQIVINDIMGCSTTDTVIINTHDQIEIIIDSIRDATCLTSSDGFILAHIVGGVPPYFTNSPLYENNLININDLSRGIYLIEVRDSVNCGNSKDVEIDYIDSVYVDILQEDEILYYGESIILNVDYHSSSQLVDFSWTPSEGLNCSDCQNPTATPLTDTDYYLTMVDENGCYSSDSVKIDVVSNVLYMPNAFTPNNDGLNDKFKSVGYLEGVSNYTLMIFNRYGQFIAEIHDPFTGWDGYYNGKVCHQGTYVWKLIYEFEENPYSNGPITEQGVVTLLR
jgi:gliding motility-associated-like protein